MALPTSPTRVSSAVQPLVMVAQQISGTASRLRNGSGTQSMIKCLHNVIVDFLNPLFCGQVCPRLLEPRSIYSFARFII